MSDDDKPSLVERQLEKRKVVALEEIGRLLRVLVGEEGPMIAPRKSMHTTPAKAPEQPVVQEKKPPEDEIDATPPEEEVDPLTDED